MIKLKRVQSQLIYVVILVALIIIVAFLVSTGELSWKDAGTAILALFSTFLGATFAFRLNESKEQEKLAEAQKGEVNRSLFILIRQYNALTQIKKELDKHSSTFDLIINLPALRVPNYGDLMQNLAGLDFLLSTYDPNILFNLAVEQERFEQSMEALRMRSEFYVHELQPAIELHNLNKRSVSASEFERIVGERISETAKNLTLVLKMHIDESIRSNQEVYLQLRATALQLYPNTNFLKYMP